MTTLIISIAVAAVLATAVHELGHAFAMRVCGLRIKRISLAGFAGLGTITLPVRIASFPGTAWVIHPLLLGAYVEPENINRVHRIPMRYQFYIYGMGPIASLLYVLAWTPILAIAWIPFSNDMLFSTAFAASVGPLAVICAYGIWKWRYEIAAYALVPITLALIPLAIYAYVAFKPFTSALITLREHKTQALAAVASGNTPLIILYGFTIGVVISAAGLINLLPLFPLDGGRIVGSMLSKYWREKYMRWSAGFYALVMFIIVITIVAYSLVRFFS